MSKLLKNAKKKTGQYPGSLIYTGERGLNGIQITIINYTKDDFRVRKVEDIASVQKFAETDELTWLNIDGIHNTNFIGKIGEIFNIHPLTLEDILNTSHRPKTEDNLDYIFIVLKMLTYDSKKSKMKSEQVSLVINNKFLLSFQEDKIDEFEGIRENIKTNKGHIRDWGTDFLAYRILDLIVDNYFILLENIGDRIEAVEDELLLHPDENCLRKIYEIKEDLLLIRRAAWPLRETVSSLERIDSVLLNRKIRPYVRDVYDHVIQIIDTTENYREMVSALQDIYLSTISNKMNEIMKVLTIISTIFIPLNFIAGVYGMNFNTEISKYNMPELNWVFGYPMILTVMLSVSAGLIFFFKRKKWF